MIVGEGWRDGKALHHSCCKLAHVRSAGRGEVHNEYDCRRTTPQIIWNNLWESRGPWFCPGWRRTRISTEVMKMMDDGAEEEQESEQESHYS